MKRCSTFISEGAGMFELRDASAGYKETVIVHHASLRVERERSSLCSDATA